MKGGTCGIGITTVVMRGREKAVVGIGLTMGGHGYRDIKATRRT